MYNNHVEFSVLEGKVLKEVIVDREYDDKITFYCTDGTIYQMMHYQDCCEDVRIKDINGEFDLLIGHTILLAEKTSSDLGENNYECEEWTFYKLVTVNGYVNLSWFGSSNCYYSTDVNFYQIGGSRE